MNETNTETGEAFRLGMLAADATEIENHPYYIHPFNGEARSLEPFLRQPLRQQTTVQLETIQSLVAYSNRFKKEQSSIYFQSGRIKVRIDHRSPTELVWQDHSAELVLRQSPEFDQWLEQSGQWQSQEQFADFLELHAREIVAPDSAEIIEITRALYIQKNAAVTSIVRTGGNLQMVFSGEQKVKGGPNDVDVPAWFEIRVRPFEKEKSWVDIRARLRVRISNEHPQFCYDLQDVQEKRDQVLDEILAGVAEKTGLPLYR